MLHALLLCGLGLLLHLAPNLVLPSGAIERGIASTLQLNARLRQVSLGVCELGSHGVQLLLVGHCRHCLYLRLPILTPLSVACRQLRLGQLGTCDE